jgi:hypothetical protein
MNMYYNQTQDCGCEVSVTVDTPRCYCGPEDYCYCYDYADGLTDVTIKYCSQHGGS